MDDFLIRQLSQIRLSISNYRKGTLDMNSLTQRVEAIGNIIGGEFWEERLFPLVLDLESINSELIDKSRDANSDERERINIILNLLETISDEPQPGKAQ